MEGQNMPEKVHSQMVRAGSKNYFFDVKKASNGSHYLTIAESYKKKDGEKVINRIMLLRTICRNFPRLLRKWELIFKNIKNFSKVSSFDFMSKLVFWLVRSLMEDKWPFVV